MASNSYNFEILQGSSFTLNVTAKDSAGTPLILSGYNARGLIRYQYSTGVLFDLTPTITGPASGVIALSGVSTGCAALPVGKFPYDVEIYTGNYAIKVLRGYVTIEPEATY